MGNRELDYTNTEVWYDNSNNKAMHTTKLFTVPEDGIIIASLNGVSDQASVPLTLKINNGIVSQSLANATYKSSHPGMPSGLGSYEVTKGSIIEATGCWWYTVWNGSYTTVVESKITFIPYK